MIEALALSKAYSGVTAVEGVSFTVEPGTVLGFLGPNGAGKSTTMRMLAGTLAPTAGTARVGGVDVRADGPAVRALVGYLPENNPLYEEMETADYLEWCGAARGLAGARLRDRVRGAVAACGLAEALGRPLGVLSKGTRQRVGLAAAIVHDPPVLILDEPTSGLDPNQAREVRALIRSLKAEKTVLLSTHVLSEVEAVCDRAVIIAKGRIAAAGTLAELSRLGGPPRVRVTLASAGLDREDARAALAGLPGVAAAAPTPSAEGEAAFDLQAPPEARAAAFQLAARRGWTLLGLENRAPSLEEVFRGLAGEP
jgi:ABC-2 type transport system ATP-binding protein